MNKLSIEIHGILDYFTVLFLFISPLAFQFLKLGFIFTYALGTVHLLVTLLTDFRPGIFKLIPLKIHGLIELIVAIILIGVGIWFNINGDIRASYFYFAFSVVLFAFWFVSDYHVAAKTHS